MLQKLFRLIVTLIFSSQILALEYFPGFGESEGCKVAFRKVEKLSRTFLKCPKVDFEREEEAIDNKLLRWGSIKAEKDIYIVLFMTKGVHGEKAIIFSSSTGEKIREINSSWPIEVVKEKSVTLLKYKKDSDPHGRFRPYYFRFK